MRALLLITSLLLSASCAKKEPSPTPAQVPSYSGSAWSSAECAPRTHERRIFFQAGGRATFEDRVSPCPPDATCVWSGVIHGTASWRADTTSLTIVNLTTDRALSQPLAERFSFDPSTSTLTDETGCVWSRWTPPASDK